MLVMTKRMNGILLAIVVLLLIPFTAMQFSEEVNWTVFDFVVAGILLTGTGMACEFVFQKFPKTTHRIAICGSILLLLCLVWVELAVGIFGTPFGGS